MADVNNLLLLSKKYFRGIERRDQRAREPRRAEPAHLDHADHINVARDQISFQWLYMHLGVRD